MKTRIPFLPDYRPTLRGYRDRIPAALCEFTLRIEFSDFNYLSVCKLPTIGGGTEFEEEFNREIINVLKKNTTTIWKS